MTTSVRDGDKWDFTKHAFKEHDPFCEPGLISILCLTSGKPKITATCFDATIEAAKAYAGEIEWIFLDQSDNESDRGANVMTLAHYNYTLERCVVVLPNRNYGINNGLNQMFALSRGEYCMIHENDWLNIQPDLNFMQRCKDIFEQYPAVDIIQMRDPKDPCENWGYGKPEHSPWSCDQSKVSVFDGYANGSDHFRYTRFANGYNHNPMMIRKKLWREVAPLNEPPFGTDPRHDETHMQRKIGERVVAHIGSVYQHIGGSRRGSFES